MFDFPVSYSDYLESFPVTSSSKIELDKQEGQAIETPNKIKSSLNDFHEDFCNKNILIASGILPQNQKSDRLIDESGDHMLRN